MSRAGSMTRQGAFGEYRISIRIYENFTNISKNSEANKIFEFVKVLQESDFDPASVNFMYLPHRARNDSGRVDVRFNDWADIATIEQILERME